MYRESLLGVAFAATLSELSETHHLTEPQRSNLWAVFDRVMDGCLAETPPITRVVVRTPVDEYPSASIRKKQEESTRMQTPMEEARLITEEIVDQVSDDNDININEERNEEKLCSNLGISEEKDNNSCTRDITNDNQHLCTSNCTNTNNVRTASMHTTVTDATLPFPVYRCVDGLWTILMKNPEVSVRDEFGVEEKLKLDYLKVYLKDVSRKNEVASKQKRTKSATTRRRKRERHLTAR